MNRPKDDTNCTLAELFEYLRRSSDFLGEEGSVEVRSVALQRGGTFLHFATVARVVPKEQSRPPSVIEVQDARLVSHCQPCSRLPHWDSLREHLTSWRLSMGASSGYQFDNGVKVDRFRGRSEWGVRPCYVFRLNEEDRDGDPIAGTTPLPNRPFLTPDRALFAESFAALAAEYLDEPGLARANMFPRTYRLVIPDHTGWISSVERNDRRLSLRVSGLKAQDGLVGGAVGIGFDNRKMRASAPVKSGEVTIQFERAAKFAEAWLLLPSGEWLDRYEEVGGPIGWDGVEVHGDPLTSSSLDLLREIDQGESESLEFKPWIDLRPRDTKRYELLTVACSFANGVGGSILIGVSDDATIQAFSKERKRLGHQSAEYNEALDAYSTQLRRFLNEGIRPSVRFEITQHEVAGQHVLRVQVRTGPDRPHSVAEDGKIFIRRGGTSRPVRQDEALRLAPPGGLE